MAKKKNITSTDIISFYMEYTLEHNTAPKSVYIFAKKYNFIEEIFYKYFGNFLIFLLAYSSSCEVLLFKKGYAINHIVRYNCY